jgi:hypothetical protein
MRLDPSRPDVRDVLVGSANGIIYEASIEPARTKVIRWGVLGLEWGDAWAEYGVDLGIGRRLGLHMERAGRWTWEKARGRVVSCEVFVGGAL